MWPPETGPCAAKAYKKHRNIDKGDQEKTIAGPKQSLNHLPAIITYMSIH
jgi:hypothetical protein